MRAPAAEIEELHMLGRAINNMLDRIEQQFNKGATGGAGESGS